VVYDELGFHQATSVAELLTARGCSVEIMTPGAVVAQDLGLTLDLERFHRRAHSAGITLRGDRVVTAAVSRGPGMVLTVLHHTTGQIDERQCDWVVSAVPPIPDAALWPELRGGHRPVHRIGDCLAPRRADAAIRDGERIGVEL